MADASRNNYILVLIRALEKRSENGDIDAALADHIERLLGVGKPDPAGEAEYASWTRGVMASDGYRTCEFCGCHTNAKVRACCEKGRAADGVKEGGDA